MDDSAHSPLDARLAKLDDRLTKIEEKHEKKTWVDGFRNAGIIVGCILGVIGGLTTVIERWNEYTAKPKIVVSAGGELVIRVDSQGNAILEHGLAVQNTGKASDTMTSFDTSILQPIGILAKDEILHQA